MFKLGDEVCYTSSVSPDFNAIVTIVKIDEELNGDLRIWAFFRNSSTVSWDHAKYFRPLTKLEKALK